MLSALCLRYNIQLLCDQREIIVGRDCCAQIPSDKRLLNVIGFDSAARDTIMSACGGQVADIKAGLQSSSHSITFVYFVPVRCREQMVLAAMNRGNKSYSRSSRCKMISVRIA